MYKLPSRPGWTPYTFPDGAQRSGGYDRARTSGYGQGYRSTGGGGYGGGTRGGGGRRR